MTTSTAINIIGLGPGRWDDLTLQARACFAQAAQEGTSVYFRTYIHPTVEPLRQAFPDLRCESFDTYYEESDDWAALYQRIARQVCDLAAQQPLLYAVPGHPLIGEASVQLLLQLARERGLSTHIIAGLSFLEPVCEALQLDPFTAGMQLVDATELAALRPDEIAGKIIPTMPLLIAQVYNRRLASDVKLALGECYPDEWPVRLVRAAGVVGDEQVSEMALYELDRNSFANHLSTLYVPPLGGMAALRLPETLRYITYRLRREPDGCPWDRQQTHQSLIHYVLEETYEVVEALEENDMEKLAEELGDLLLQVYLHSEIARQEENFAIGDVFEHVNAKLIRRHPHVFGDVEVNSAGQVVQNWEAIKRQERMAAGTDVQLESLLDRLPPATPALMTAQEYQKRAAKAGFDYKSLQDILTKLSEELRELQEASTPDQQFEEMGDVLFMAARIARELHIDAEQALRQANRKFKQRFQEMESMARAEGRELTSYNSPEWRALWKRAKENADNL
ncbi:MAG TPA: nucleoside triphosphate pyrophosphohydrolase [Ktedonobacteraceae bacterium]|nr:nucleoside triphosphate pyrophosphohydrolase [Ktedonobacteraceae bacterium]